MQAMGSEHEADGGLTDGPEREERVDVLDEVHRDFVMLVDAVRDLGAIRSCRHPRADAAVVVSTSVIQIVADLRTTLLQDLEAMLRAEQASATTTIVLVALAREMGKERARSSLRAGRARRSGAPRQGQRLGFVRAGLAAPGRASE